MYFNDHLYVAFLLGIQYTFNEIFMARIFVSDVNFNGCLCFLIDF